MTSPTRLVGGVDFITLWTRDFEVAEEFYGATLGLPCIERYARVPEPSSRRATSPCRCSMPHRSAASSSPTRRSPFTSRT
jgi:catechol 2,3-dioxygenase-like lactoylglutathione lyase family enzyme